MASSTPNINLTLPVGSENVSRQIINDNNTKIDDAIGALPSGQNLQGEIDALNSNITALAEYESIGSVASQSELETALNNKIATMETGTNVSISVVISTAFEPFAKTTYYAKLSKVTGTNNFATALFEACNITGNKLLIKATKASGTWYFEGVASSIINLYIGNNATKTFILEGRTQYIFTMSYLSNGNISGDPIIAVISTPDASNKTGAIKWISGTPSSTTPVSLSGLTFTVSSNGAWPVISLTKL